MSERETTDRLERTCGMEPQSVELERSQQGTDIIAELRARSIAQQIEALKRIAYWHRRSADSEAASGSLIANSRLSAFFEVMQWIDELSGCDVVSTGEAGTPKT